MRCAYTIDYSRGAERFFAAYCASRFSLCLAEFRSVFQSPYVSYDAANERLYWPDGTFWVMRGVRAAWRRTRHAVSHHHPRYQRERGVHPV